MALLKWMGVGTTEKPTVNDVPIGLENALYYSRPFRDCVLNFDPSNPYNAPSSPHLGAATPYSTHSASSYFSHPLSSSLNSSQSMPATPVTPNGALSSASLTRSYTHQRGPSQNGTSSSSTTTVTASASAALAAAHAPPRTGITGVLLPNGGGPDPDSAPKESLFRCLQDLFWQIQNHSKKTQYFTPTAFVAKVKKENELFRSSMHQDAHEFLMFLMNTIAEDVEAEIKKYEKEAEEQLGKMSNGSYSGAGAGSARQLSESMDDISVTTANGDEVRIKINGTDPSPDPAQKAESTSTEKSSIHSDSTAPKPKEKIWVQKLFEGQLTNEIKCLTCEKTTSRAESFMDLSIDIEQNSSVTSCLRQFSASEMLCHKDKFYCDECCGLQEAEKRMKIKQLPNILSLHLKRFKYQEALQKYVKLSYRVAFPMELRLFNTVDDMEDPDRIYDLFAFVVHIGSGPHHGHYVAVVKNGDKWLLFDDDTVETIEETDIHKYFGDSAQLGSGYVLFYEARDLDMNTIFPMPWSASQSQYLQGAKSPGLNTSDVDLLSGLSPHHQQQELINQQLAASGSSRLGRRLSSGQHGFLGGSSGASSVTAGLSALFGGGSSTSNSNSNSNGRATLTSPSPAHLGPASSSPGRSSTMPLQHANGTSSSVSQSSSNSGGGVASWFSSSSGNSSSKPQPSYTVPATPNGASFLDTDPAPSLGGYFGSGHTKASSSSTTSLHTNATPEKLKRTQSSPRISFSSATKSLGGSGGKSFIGSLRGGIGGGSNNN
ncbi:hypothetical protein BGW42_005595 [Actinomortierella wolfii]|nr:hypothetical protein BGW42_005595 [Actinomortierella wolfii]